MNAIGKQKERIGKIISLLQEMHPNARCELEHKNPLDLLVATILSAQCTDERVNRVTKTLFKKYRTTGDYAQSSLEELMEDIRPTGFFRNKAKMIRECTRELIARFDGRVPATLEDLVSLPGVGRKTANVVLGTAFDIPGITVDTHVLRLSQRLALTDNNDPVKVEFELMNLIPQNEWVRFSHLLIFHGRYICKARTPLCGKCALPKFCGYFQRQLPVK
ncbi:MAG: endonuclease III [Deltaproteobacteria bacterium]|nr:endonuclease III [Deltaproteobacteria bacterium]